MQPEATWGKWGCRLACIILLLSSHVHAQELFVFSEPASNIPAKSISGKITGRYPDSKYNEFFKQRYVPEVMFGINKNLMVSFSAAFSDFYNYKVRWESVKLYSKYRFLSIDGVHRHFRMAAYGAGSVTRSPFLYGELTLDGDNDGVEGGVIATQLINKFAVSGSLGMIKVFAEKGEHTAHAEHSTAAWTYSFSMGYLLFPLKYRDYKQTNVNLYVELLGMKGVQTKHDMIDIAPAIQFIFNSNFKVNAGCRFQVQGNMQRVGERNIVVGIERTFLNALKKKKVDS